MWYRRGTEKSYLSLAEGLAEILPDRVIVLARVAERAEDIDLTRAQMGVNRAEERLAKPSPDLDMERARIALIKQLTRVRVAQKARTRS
jgi:F-type H+-transporting ATPase subunit epsilon